MTPAEKLDVVTVTAALGLTMLALLLGASLTLHGLARLSAWLVLP